MFKLKNKKLILSILMCICAAFFACGIFAISNTKDKGQTVTAEAASTVTPVYWRYDSSNTTLTLSSTELTGGTASGLIPDNQPTLTTPWTQYRSNITTVNIANKIVPKSTNSWFYSCPKLTTINNISNLDMSQSTNMYAMLLLCSSLQSIDVSAWDTSNVTDMFGVFCVCAQLTSLDLSNWDTSKVTTMYGMFEGCDNLATLDVSGWDTSQVTTFRSLFHGCSSLKTLDLSNFDATKATNTGDMLAGMTGLESIKLSQSLVNKIAQNGDTGITMPLCDAEGNIYTSESQLTEAGLYFTSKHEHDFKLTSVTREATCSKEGEELYTCAHPLCDSTQTKSIPKKAHTEEADEAKAATCIETGLTAGSHCKVCGEVFTAQKVINALNHSWGEWQVTKAPTEAEEGEKQRVCQREGCGAIDNGTVDMLDHTHKFAEGWSNNETHHWHDSTCGHDEKSGLETHAWDEGQETKAPTCAATGIKTFTCTICSKTKTETINKIAHTHESVAAVEPDCTSTGLTEGSRCKVCGETLTAQEVVSALGHDYQAVEGGVAPTCTTEGSGKVVCSRCNDEQVGASIPALGHIEVTDEAKTPTCTETGLTEGKHCSRCEEVLTAQQEVPALGHDWSTEWSKDETNHWHICSRCDEKNNETAHTYEWVKTKEPTVDETGLKENFCTVCGNKDGEEELAKLVVDDNGSVGDLPAGNVYDLEIAVKESDSLYNIPGITKGYKVELFVVEGEDRNPYDNNKVVTLMLVIPEGMEDEFTLYCRHGEILERVDSATYTVNGKSVTIRTTLPNEYVFNAPAPDPEEPSSGIPWWVWLIVGLVAAALLGIFIIIIVVAKKKKDDDDGTPVDNGEVLSQLAEQGQKIDELLNRGDDGGFNTPVELDENGNVIFK